MASDGLAGSGGVRPPVYAQCECQCIHPLFKASVVPDRDPQLDVDRAMVKEDEALHFIVEHEGRK